MIKILGFDKSSNPNKKYDVYISDGNNIKKISFGATNYEQYHDKIGLYKDLDHHDDNRRRLYKIRHERDRHVKWSPGWFSDQYLW